MKRCKHCHAPLGSDERVCPSCGTPVARHRARNAALITFAVLIVLIGGVTGALFATGRGDLVTGLPGLFMGGGDGSGSGGSGGGAGTGDSGDGGEGIDTSFVALGEGFTTRSVTSEDEARAAIEDVAEPLGITDVDEDLGAAVTGTALGTSYYRFTEQYEGLSVYGRSVVVSADEAGASLGLTSNFRAVDGVDVTPTITSKQAQDVAANAADEAELAICQDLVVYSLYDVEPVAAWQVVVVDGDGLWYCFVSAQEGDVVAWEHASGDATGTDLEGETVEFNTEPYGDGYAIIDGSRNVRVYDASGTDRAGIISGVAMIGEHGTTLRLVPNSNGSFVWSVDGKTEASIRNDEQGHSFIVHDDGTEEQITGTAYEYDEHLATSEDDESWASGPVTLTDAVSTIYDYYLQVLDWKGYDGQGGSIHAVYGLNENNAFSWCPTGDFAVLAAGGSLPFCGTLVMGHEFTHAVVAATCGLSGPDESETGPLNEGISDLVAVAASDMDDDGIANNSHTWVLDESGRDLENPARLDGPSVYEGADYWLDNTDPATENSSDPYVDTHHNATVIGHAGYLMCAEGDAAKGLDGEALTTEQMAKVIFLSLLSMPSDCTFVQFGTIMENSAATLCAQGGINEAQVERVSSAFDAVGISSADEVLVLAEGAAITVLDVNNEPCDNYAAVFTDTMNDRAEVANVTVDTADPLTLPVSQGQYGLYVMQLIDGTDSSNEQYKGIIVSPTGAKEATVYTTFGSVDTESDESQVARNITGTRDVSLVLDVSGSMDGDPIEQLKSAAAGFLDIALDDREQVRVGLIAYNGSAEVMAPLTSTPALLDEQVPALGAAGSTDIEEALNTAASQLETSTADTRIIVLMSDGEPTEGASGDDLISIAAQIKERGVKIYTVGFNEGASGQALLTAIASPNCHYQINAAEQLEDFFADIADEIDGRRILYVRIACPVDVTVTYDGETLSSAGGDGQTRTSFGTLVYEDEVDENGQLVEGGEGAIKVLRLHEGVSYDVQIEGTGTGTMDYSIGIMDDVGDYTDTRTFSDIEITSRTRIDTVADASSETVLSVDDDGDGVVDRSYRAGANEEGELVDNGWVVYMVMGAVAVALAAIVAVQARRLLAASAHPGRVS